MEAKFKIGTEEFGFKEITLKQYYELLEILGKEGKAAEFKVVECITGCPVPLLKKLKFNDWLIVWDETRIRIDELMGKADVIKPVIEFNGVKFALPAVEDLSIGEFADLEVIFSSANSKERLHEVAAILYRPIKKQVGKVTVLEDYTAEDVKVRAEEFLDLPVSAIRSANAFFLQSANSLLKNIQESLLKNPQMKKMSSEDQEVFRNLLQLDLGGNSSIHFAERILSDFMQQPRFGLEKPLTGLPGKKQRIKKLFKTFKDKLTIK